MKKIKKLVGKLEKWSGSKRLAKLPSGTVSINEKEIYLASWTDEFIDAEEVDLYPDFDEELIALKWVEDGQRRFAPIENTDAHRVACTSLMRELGVEGRERRKVPAEWLEDGKMLVIHVSEEE